MNTGSRHHYTDTTSQVTTCNDNNLSHSQDASNYPYMNLRDNNNNNNNTDTSNSLYEHIHLNINQYTQPIRFNNDKDSIHDNIIQTIQTMTTTRGNISENHNDVGELDSNHTVTHLNVTNILPCPVRSITIQIIV